MTQLPFVTIAKLVMDSKWTDCNGDRGCIKQSTPGPHLLSARDLLPPQSCDALGTSVNNWSAILPAMKQLVLGIAITALFVAGCSPATTTITPLQTDERVSSLPFEEAYAQTVNVVNTQPFPSDSGGWIITQTDQVGGFVEARLDGTRCSFWSGCSDYTARVSVALVRRGESTSVSISLNRHEEAQKLVDRIVERLGI